MAKSYKEKYRDEDGVWRTISGRRVFIRTGQSLSDAMKESGKFKSASFNKKEIENIKDKAEPRDDNNYHTNKEKRKKDMENDLKWFEDMNKKYGGTPLSQNEDYLSLKEQYESEFGNKESFEQAIDRIDKIEGFDERKQAITDYVNKTGTSRDTINDALAEKEYDRHLSQEYDKRYGNKEQQLSDKEDFEYNLYKKAMTDPDSIDPMTENSTDWEALDKKYKDIYEEDRAINNQIDDINKQIEKLDNHFKQDKTDSLYQLERKSLTERKKELEDSADWGALEKKYESINAKEKEDFINEKMKNFTPSFALNQDEESGRLMALADYYHEKQALAKTQAEKRYYTRKGFEAVEESGEYGKQRLAKQTAELIGKAKTDSTGTYAKNKEDQKIVNEQYIKEQSKLAQAKEKALQSRSLYADIHNEYTPEEIEYIAQDNKVHKMNSWEYPKERDEYHKFLQDKYGTYKEEEIKDENGRTDYIKLRKDFYSSRGKGATKDEEIAKRLKENKIVDSFGNNVVYQNASGNWVNSRQNYNDYVNGKKDKLGGEFVSNEKNARDALAGYDALEKVPYENNDENTKKWLKQKQENLDKIYKAIGYDDSKYNYGYKEEQQSSNIRTRVGRNASKYTSGAYTGDNSDLKAKHTKEGIASYKKEANDKIRAIITGKSRADKGLEKYGLRVERDNSAQKEFGKRYFGKKVEVIDDRTGKKIYSSYDNYFPSDDVVNAKHTSDTKGTQWHTIKNKFSYQREKNKDVRGKFNYYDYLKKPYNEAKSQGDTLGQKVAQYKQDKQYLKQHEYEIKTATKTADRYLRTKNELDNYNLKKQYQGTYEYLKNTTNMSGEEILEYLKKIKK